MGGVPRRRALVPGGNALKYEPEQTVLMHVETGRFPPASGHIQEVDRAQPTVIKFNMRKTMPTAEEMADLEIPEFLRRT